MLAELLITVTLVYCFIAFKQNEEPFKVKHRSNLIFMGVYFAIIIIMILLQLLFFFIFLVSKLKKIFCKRLKIGIDKETLKEDILGI